MRRAHEKVPGAHGAPYAYCIERVASRSANCAAWQRPGAPEKLWVGLHAAFTAPSRTAVDAAYAAAIAAGGLDEGPPGLRAEYAPDYYGAYVRDPDGNKVHFVRRATG